MPNIPGGKLPPDAQARYDEAARLLETHLPPDTLFALIFGRPPHTHADGCIQDPFHDIKVRSDEVSRRSDSSSVLSQISTAMLMGEVMGFTGEDFVVVLKRKLRETPITDPPSGQELTHANHRFQEIINYLSGPSYGYGNLRDELGRRYNSGT